MLHNGEGLPMKLPRGIHLVGKAAHWGLLVLLGGCVAAKSYVYDSELHFIAVGTDIVHVVSKDVREPIPPAKFGKWFIPSSWARELAAYWAGLPFAFHVLGPEYCTALGVDRNQMIHASVAVRYHDDTLASKGCPSLVWKEDGLIIGLGAGHSHQSLESHGARISAHDASLGSPVLVRREGAEALEMSRIAVHFFSGERLMGIDPATGREAPVPAQSLLFTRVKGAPRVFLWTPSSAETNDKQNFVTVYRPALNDDWEPVGLCWVDKNEIQQAILHNFVPATHCSPPNFWLE